MTEEEISNRKNSIVGLAQANAVTLFVKKFLKPKDKAEEDHYHAIYARMYYEELIKLAPGLADFIKESKSDKNRQIIEEMLKKTETN